MRRLRVNHLSALTSTVLFVGLGHLHLLQRHIVEHGAFSCAFESQQMLPCLQIKLQWHCGKVIWILNLRIQPNACFRLLGPQVVAVIGFQRSLLITPCTTELQRHIIRRKRFAIKRHLKFHVLTTAFNRVITCH
ncbi:hypothetical protein D3C85_1494740 [compost metagenome]